MRTTVLSSEFHLHLFSCLPCYRQVIAIRSAGGNQQLDMNPISRQIMEPKQLLGSDRFCGKNEPIVLILVIQFISG